jgi:hypothetical protein
VLIWENTDCLGQRGLIEFETAKSGGRAARRVGAVVEHVAYQFRFAAGIAPIAAFGISSRAPRQLVAAKHYDY